jgi:uncharacterized protein (DUF4213/DUF364 family)
MGTDVPDPSAQGRSETATARALFEPLIASLPGGSRTVDVTVGLHWTAVVAEREGQLRCGLASTIVAPHAHGEAHDVEQAGKLADQTPAQLLDLTGARTPTERAVGLATLNACLAHESHASQEESASEVIVRQGKGKKVAVIGHFPFIPNVRDAVGELVVFELDPSPGELPPEAAPDVLPTCSVVAMTATTLINGTFGDLMNAVDPEAYVMLLGPSAPLSPICFNHGIDLVAGTEVVDIPAVTRAVKEGANYRQIHRLGTRLVTLSASASPGR